MKLNRFLSERCMVIISCISRLLNRLVLLYKAYKRVASALANKASVRLLLVPVGADDALAIETPATTGLLSAVPLESCNEPVFKLRTRSVVLVGLAAKLPRVKILRPIILFNSVASLTPKLPTV